MNEFLHSRPESKSAGMSHGAERVRQPSWGRKYLVDLESLDEQIYLVTCDRLPVVAQHFEISFIRVFWIPYREDDTRDIFP